MHTRIQYIHVFKTSRLDLYSLLSQCHQNAVTYRHFFHLLPLSGSSREYERIRSSSAPERTGCTPRLARAEWRCVRHYDVCGRPHANLSHSRIAQRALQSVAGTHAGLYAGGSRYCYQIRALRTEIVNDNDVTYPNFYITTNNDSG